MISLNINEDKFCSAINIDVISSGNNKSQIKEINNAFSQTVRENRFNHQNQGIDSLESIKLLPMKLDK